MKKIFATALACVMSVSALACLAACGGGKEKETADREAPAYADGEWGAKLDLTGLQKGDFGEISPDLYGLFLEDINYASFALDDNLIVNGSFETVASGTGQGKQNGWTGSGTTVTVSLKSGTGALHANNPNYAEITSAAGGKLTNTGHPEVPIAVNNGVDYNFSMFIKDYAGDVTVTVKDKQGAEYAKGTFTVTESSEWTKYVKTITATASKYENLSVEIAFSAADTFSVDSVKLETTEATDFGMKNYMYKAIADLGPKFFRFPGGCVIEGKDFDSAYDWKKSIGATVTGTNAGDDAVDGFTYTVNDNGTVKEVTTYGEQATREQNVNIWQFGSSYYDHEYGIGFYEYFCLCEALGAKAVPIVNCGMSCQTQSSGSALKGRHGKGVEDYIQDAIDLIEFAKGDKNTKWGKVRADMGHPEPFEMDYLGVGNEQWGNYYTQYYEKFLTNADFKAALAKYNVRTIVGNWVSFGDCEDPDVNRKGTAQKAAEAAHRNDSVNFPDVASYGVVDQHYYVNYTDLFANTHLYDNYKRNDEENDLYYYDVFVGEYAANTGTAVTSNGTYEYTQNDWISALSEAAMMTGFERNGDIVKMAAYAPMFAVADTEQTAKIAGDNNANQWDGANMMYFTNREVVLTPSYFVQQLFMHNAGTQKVTSGLTFASGSMPTTTINKVGASGTFTYDSFYYVTSYNEETKNVIVKIVNAGDTAVKFNVNVDVGKSLTGIAQVNEIANDDPHAVSTYANGNAITPFAEKIGFENGSFGYEVKPYSVVAFQIRVK